MNISDFSELAAPNPDPIFAMTVQAKTCGHEAIDATIGVCMDERGEPLVLDTTRRAEMLRVHEMTAKDFSYPPILGNEEFRQSVRDLLLGNTMTPLASFSTAGGQGALHTNLQLLKRISGNLSLVLPTPAWVNHTDLCRGANIAVKTVEYFDQGKPTIGPLITKVEQTRGKVAVLLQVSGHNPTGLDFSPQQWSELADVFAKQGTIALLDFAYQGLTDEPDKDAEPIRLLAERGVDTLIAWSASKNHSIYSYRTGLAAAIVQDHKTKALVEGHYSDLSSELQSAAPMQGQKIVSITQQRLMKEWLGELDHIRAILREKRLALRELLGMEEFVAPLQGKGLFARLPLHPTQLKRLREEQKVFLLEDGRINIAGVPLQRIEELAVKIRKITRPA